MHPTIILLRKCGIIAWHATRVFVIGGAVLVAMAGLTRFGPPGNLVAETFCHGQWQYLLCGLAALVVALVCRMRSGVIAACIAVVLQFAAILPLYIGGESVSDAPNLRVAVFNVWGGGRHFSETSAWLAETDADVVLLQETGGRWRDYLFTLEAAYPHQHVAWCHEHQAFNVATLSRLPIRSQSEILLPPIDIPLTRTVIDVDGQDVAFYNVHVRPSMMPQRKFQDELLLAALEEETFPHVVAGDFNATVWSPRQRALERAAELKRAGAGRGVQPTWPMHFKIFTRAEELLTGATRRGKPPPFGRFAFLLEPFGFGLDHVYVSEEIGVSDFALGPRLGSDHLPMRADLYVEPRG